MLKKVFFFPAAIGAVLSITIHVAALTEVGFNFFRSWLVPVFLGMFLVWVPTVHTIDKLSKLGKLTAIKGRFGPWVPSWYRQVAPDAPKWMHALVYLAFIYSMGYFIYSILWGSHMGSKTHLNADKLRAFAGFLIMFYAIATVVLYPFRNLDKQE